MMVGMAVVRGTVVVAGSSLSHHAFLCDLGIGHA
jgi:hypothetical protein